MIKKPAYEELEQRVKKLERETENRKRVEEALRESEEKYRSMMEALIDPVYICSPDFRIEYMNPAMIQRTGRDARGEPCYKVINALEEKCPWCVFEKIKQEGEHIETEITSPMDGRHYHACHSPIFHGDGSVSKMTIYRDITRWKKTEESMRESEERYHDLYEKAPNGYLSISATDGSILMCNSAAMQLLGYERETLLEMKIFDLYADTRDGKSKAREVFKRFQAGESIEGIELQMEYKDGNPIWISLSVDPMRDHEGNVIASRSIVQDISKRKLAEEALRKAHDELERRVEQRTEELFKTNEQLQQEIEEHKRVEEELKKSEEELQRLSYQLLNAHEKERKRIALELHDSIGQNLSAIKYLVENAFQEIRDEKAENGARLLEPIVHVIKEAVEEVRRIQKNLRPPILDDLGILPTITWFSREFETTYPGIRIKKEIDIREDDVPNSLKIIIFRILQEALNNIAKHSQAKLVRLSLKGSDGKIDLTVKDNGVGFDLERVLTEERSKRGIGLASMKERTELSGGSFWIESQKGDGTRICATWSLSRRDLKMSLEKSEE